MNKKEIFARVNVGEPCFLAAPKFGEGVRGRKKMSFYGTAGPNSSVLRVFKGFSE